MNTDLYESDLYNNEKLENVKITESFELLKQKILNIFNEVGIPVKDYYSKPSLYDNNIIIVETEVTKPFSISKLKYYLSEFCSKENIKVNEDQGKYGIYSKVFSFYKNI